MKPSKSVVIGTREWMTRNLNVHRFRNEDPIPLVFSAEKWAAAAKQGLPACCFLENMRWIGSSYGKLYNCFSVSCIKDTPVDLTPCPQPTEPAPVK
jgi:hypothetical protein